MPKMTKKWIDAGPLHIEVLTSRIQRSDSQATRKEKKKLTTAAQQLINSRLSKQKLELDLAANYVPGDLIMTLTYDDDHLPFRRQQCFQAMKYFRKKLSAEYRKHGAELVMHSNIEHRHGEGRWHHHCVCNAADVDYQTIAELWGRGYIKFQRLLIGKYRDPDNVTRLKEYSYEGLAAYMTKERQDKPSQRCWTYTKNAKHPTIETALVDADTTLQPPPGSQQLATDKRKNRFGRMEYIKYINATLPHRKTKRRKNKS